MNVPHNYWILNKFLRHCPKYLTRPFNYPKYLRDSIFFTLFQSQSNLHCRYAIQHITDHYNGTLEYKLCSLIKLIVWFGCAIVKLTPWYMWRSFLRALGIWDNWMAFLGIWGNVSCFFLSSAPTPPEKEKDALGVAGFYRNAKHVSSYGPVLINHKIRQRRRQHLDATSRVEMRK